MSPHSKYRETTTRRRRFFALEVLPKVWKSSQDFHIHSSFISTFFYIFLQSNISYPSLLPQLLTERESATELVCLAMFRKIFPFPRTATTICLAESHI